jgi:hypothetical protein
MEWMSLRDYFAAKIMQALITRETKMIPDPLMYAGAAYDLADAMLEVRKNDPQLPAVPSESCKPQGSNVKR